MTRSHHLLFLSLIRQHARGCLFDTSPLKRRGILLSSSPLARLLCRETRRGALSRSVSQGLHLARSCLPDSTVHLFEDVHSSVVVAVKHNCAPSANMRSHGETFFDACATDATILARESWRNRKHR